MANAKLPPLYHPETHTVSISQEAGWAPVPGWTGEGILAPTKFDPRTTQPVTSCYADYALPTHVLSLHHLLSLPTSCFPTGFPIENSGCLPLPRIFPSCDAHTFHGHNNKRPAEGKELLLVLCHKMLCYFVPYLDPLRYLPDTLPSNKGTTLLGHTRQIITFLPCISFV